MYMDDDTMTPRDRIGEDMLRLMLNSNNSRPSLDLPPSSIAPSPCLPSGGWGLREHPVGMVYAPLQEFRQLYDLESALAQGTIFRELDLPFMGESVASRGDRCKGGACHD